MRPPTPPAGSRALDRYWSRPHEIEWPTVALLASVHIAWMAATFWLDAIPTPLAVVLGALIVTLHGSLQHEVIHGHPTPWKRLNHALASLPIGLWLPFSIYRTSHLRHHASDLTDPVDDPESYYVSPQAWRFMGPVMRGLCWVYTTLVGRMLLGPFVSVGRLVVDEVALLSRGDRRHARAWLHHAAGVTLVLGWVVGVCDVAFTTYLAVFAYPGLALTLMRSFAEHVRHRDPRLRTAVVESKVLGAVFLWNSLHVVHHRYPTVPWYHYWVLYRERSREFADRSAAVFRDYLELFGRYALRPHHHPAAAPGGVEPVAAYSHHFAETAPR